MSVLPVSYTSIQEGVLEDVQRDAFNPDLRYSEAFTAASSYVFSLSGQKIYLEMMAVRFRLRNVSFRLRNVSFKLRNVSVGTTQRVAVAHRRACR